MRQHTKKTKRKRLSSLVLALISCFVLATGVGAVPKTSITQVVNSNGEHYDLLIQGGTLIDTAQGLNGQYDIAVRNGKVAQIFKNNENRVYHADQVIDARGLIVTPGLIDMHTHVSSGPNSGIGLNPDSIGIKQGVTTLVDAGTYGVSNFPKLFQGAISQAKTRIVSLLNISKDGLINEDIDNSDLPASLELIKNDPQYIKGIKIRMENMVVATKQSDGLVALINAKRLAKDAGLPLEVHIGAPPPNLAAVLNILDPGDIVVHTYHGKQGGILDDQELLRPEVKSAMNRGVIFDVGHGATSFSFDVAQKSMAQGLIPDVISSDLHTGSISLVQSLVKTMNKFLALGMPLEDVIQRTTENPAKVIRMEKEIGSLQLGRTADITLLKLTDEKETYTDCVNATLTGEKKLTTEYTIRDGKVVYQNFLEASIPEIQNALELGQVTSEELVQFYLDRINQYDQRGPKLNAIIALNPKALDEAKALDQERQTKGSRGLLMGIPIVLKDNFDTYDMPTTGGNKAMKTSQPTQDAFLTQKLRDAGAIIIAKANLHELARAGWTNSSLLGQTLNPYDLTRTPGGSSGGTADAVAANFAVAGMGTDTVNSVRSPASADNLVGFRPTYGLYSRRGIIPAALTQDMAGAITRTVTDSAVMMNVLAGVDPADSVTSAAQGHIEKDYTKFLDPNGLKGKRIGVVREIVGKDPEVTKVFEKDLEILKAQGATLIDINNPNFNTGKISKECDVQLWESTPQLDDYFKTLGSDAPIKSTSELLATGTVEAGILKLMTDSTNLMPNNLTSLNYKQALEKGQELRDLINETFKGYKLDAMVYPHQQVLVSKVIDHAQPGRNGILASIGMTPAITIPGGFSTPTVDAPLGVPVGLEFMGKQWSEPTLFSIAFAFEQATQYRTLPRSTP